ncbi:MAG: hypothetical protein ACOX3W_04135 [Christensenellaceae bacterium]
MGFINNRIYTEKSEDYCQWLYPEIKELSALNAGEIILVISKGDNDVLQVGDKIGMIYADSELPFTEAKENPSSIYLSMVEVTIAQIVELDIPKTGDITQICEILTPIQTLALHPYYDIVSNVQVYVHPQITEAEQAALDKAVDKIIETTSAEY